jgi:nucleotide-binding universal stress UspA family protein
VGQGLPDREREMHDAYRQLAWSGPGEPAGEAWAHGPAALQALHHERDGEPGRVLCPVAGRPPAAGAAPVWQAIVEAGRHAPGQDPARGRGLARPARERGRAVGSRGRRAGCGSRRREVGHGPSDVLGLRHVVGDHIPTALLDLARAEDATQLVMGTSRRGHLLPGPARPAHRSPERRPRPPGADSTGIGRHPRNRPAHPEAGPPRPSGGGHRPTAGARPGRGVGRAARHPRRTARRRSAPLQRDGLAGLHP